MMKFLPVILQLVAACGAAALALTLKTPDSRATGSGDQHSEQARDDQSDHAEDAPDNKHDKKDPRKAKKKKKDNSHGKPDSHGGGAVSGSAYIKFSRQFIVPVPATSDRNYLMVLDVNLEMDSSASDDAYAMEPKVRDALLQTLLQLSSGGTFSGRYLEENNMDTIRASLLASARSVLGDDVKDVLILSIARQGS